MRLLISSVSAVGLLALVGASPLLAQNQPVPNPNPDVGACIASDMSSIDQDKAAIETAQSTNNKTGVDAAYHKLHDDIAQLRYDRGVCPPSTKADR